MSASLSSELRKKYNVSPDAGWLSRGYTSALEAAGGRKGVGGARPHCGGSGGGGPRRASLEHSEPQSGTAQTNNCRRR